MGRLTSFQFITLDGYYKGINEDISWHRHESEEAEYSAESLRAENILLFGRKTYDMMADFWPSAMAAAQFPEVAAGMNKAEKIVCSRHLQAAAWVNTRIVAEDITAAIRRLKQETTKDITLLGSGSILTQLADAKLVDEYQVMIDPVVIGGGTSLFQYISQPLQLSLIGTRRFRSGAVLNTYRPVVKQL